MSPAHIAEPRVRIARLFIYPVKSCGGVEVSEALVTETGFDLDRAWMVVDAAGEFVSQRELPRMALVRVQLRHSDVVLRAPGMLPLHLQVDAVEEPTRVRVWDDELPAYDMGAVAAQWFTDFLGRPLRLARFDPEQRRLSSLDWTGGIEAANQFSDGFPLLAVSEASLQALNDRLLARGHAPVGIERFRPNIVLSGLEAHDEDRLAHLRREDGAAIVLQPVKPCGRCTIPDVDPATGEQGTVVADTLQAYRRNEAMDGAVCFGMNVIVREGEGQTLKRGQAFTGEWKFD